MYSPSALIYRRQEEAQAAAQALSDLRVVSKRTRTAQEEAPPPYITLTLLEDAAAKLGWPGKRAMSVAQTLFEQGLITYPRTDATRVAPRAKEAAREIIRARYGAKSLKRDAPAAEVGAHEAIRPTDPRQTPAQQAGLLADQAALYQLIWRRFLASQMKAARYQVIDVELESV